MWQRLQELEEQRDVDWYAVHAEAGYQTLYAPHDVSRGEICEVNRSVPGFEILYGPAPVTEVREYLNDLNPNWERDMAQRRGLSGLMDLLAED